MFITTITSVGGKQRKWVEKYIIYLRKNRHFCPFPNCSEITKH